MYVYHFFVYHVCLTFAQAGNDRYRLTSTSENGGKKKKRDKRDQKDLEELKKEVDLVRNFSRITNSNNVHHE